MSVPMKIQEAPSQSLEYREELRGITVPGSQPQLSGEFEMQSHIRPHLTFCLDRTKTVYNLAKFSTLALARQLRRLRYNQILDFLAGLDNFELALIVDLRNENALSRGNPNQSLERELLKRSTRGSASYANFLRDSRFCPSRPGWQIANNDHLLQGSICLFSLAISFAAKERAGIARGHVLRQGS